MHEEEHVRVNRDGWDRVADEYQQLHERQISAQALTGDISWGLWAIPESRLNVLGDVEGKDVLELGCGGAQWSMALARRGARPIGLDLSGRQLVHARRLMNATEISFPLLQASAERVPLRDSSFDEVFADHGHSRSPIHLGPFPRQCGSFGGAVCSRSAMSARSTPSPPR